MKLQYLGTAAAEGVPGLFCQCPMCQYARKTMGKEYRARSGAVINDRLMIDFPPDVYATCLRIGVTLPEVTHVLFTHSHRDHCCISELLFRADPAFCIRTQTEPLHLYGNEEIERRVKEMEEGELAAPNLTFDYLPPFQPREIAGVTVTPLLAFHNPPEKAYLYLLEQEGKRLLYGHDTGVFPEETFAYLAGKALDLVSLDCTAGVLGCQGGHMGLPQNQQVKRRLEELGCAPRETLWVVNHFSHNGLRWPKENLPVTWEQLEEEAQKSGFTASYDGRIFHI